jgi:3-deoxy-manno-octulosonate cytidylyltransferase (CMP-KDO synthetase)
VQGDEPLIDPGAIDAAILPLLDEPSIPMGTLKKRIEDPREVGDPNVVKVVTDRFENAIYFSRSTVPYPRDQAVEKALSPAMRESPVHYKHIGLYVYRRDFLLRYPGMPVGPLEKAERLEQLRALENGHKMRVVETEYESIGVDTPDDLERVNKLFEATLAGVIQNG